jgi:hypothetical protein
VKDLHLEGAMLLIMCDHERSEESNWIKPLIVNVIICTVYEIDGFLLIPKVIERFERFLQSFFQMEIIDEG